MAHNAVQSDSQRKEDPRRHPDCSCWDFPVPKPVKPFFGLGDSRLKFLGCFGVGLVVAYNVRSYVHRDALLQSSKFFFGNGASTKIETQTAGFRVSQISMPAHVSWLNTFSYAVRLQTKDFFVG